MPVSDCAAVAAAPLQKPDYGIDAPLVVRRFLLFGISLREIVRVMKQGARLMIIDIRRTADYAATLKQIGLRDLRRRGPNFMFVIPSYTVAATKA